MLLIVDNYDSFTFNLVHIVKELAITPYRVVKNDQIPFEEMEQFDKVLFSPGPGVPSEAGDMLKLIKEYGNQKLMLGICLGHQAIAEVYGARLRNLEEVYHGIASQVKLVERDSLFQGMPDLFQVGRYHSWIVDDADFPECLKVLAGSSDGQIMALKHRDLGLYGVQFHPESVLTPNGKSIIRNFLSM